MKTKNKISFDELDIKCLKEMPLILQVLSSTGNKLTSIFKAFYSEMNDQIKTSLKLNWEINKKETFPCRIFPLTEEDGKDINITIFETDFQIDSMIYSVKTIKGKEVNYFFAQMGYRCHITEEKEVNKFYFFIYKGNLRERWGGVINPLKFYNQIKAKLSDYNIDILHKDQGDDEESIELKIEEFSMEKIQDGFNVFKSQILQPFLDKLE